MTNRQKPLLSFQFKPMIAVFAILGFVAFSQAQDEPPPASAVVSAQAVMIDPETGEQIEIDAAELNLLLESATGGTAMFINAESGQFDGIQLGPNEVSQILGGLTPGVGKSNFSLSQSPGETEEAFKSRIQKTIGSRFNLDANKPKTLDYYRKLLEIDDDQEWELVKPLIESVLAKVRLKPVAQQGFQLSKASGEQAGARMQLQRAIYSGNDPGIQSAMAQIRAAQGAESAALTAACERLREVLDVKQEGWLVIEGLLD